MNIPCDPSLIRYPATRRCEVCEDSTEQKHKLDTQCVAQVKCYGIFGQVELPTGPHLIMIEKATLVGQLIETGSEILKVEKLLYIPLKNAKAGAALSQQDKPAVDMIENIQANKSFYFSFKLDLTKTM